MSALVPSLSSLEEHPPYGIFQDLSLHLGDIVRYLICDYTSLLVLITEICEVLSHNYIEKLVGQKASEKVDKIYPL